MQFTLTRQQFDARRAQVAATTGEALTGDTGTVAYKGVTLRYECDEPALTVTLLKKPLIVPTSHVEGQIKDWFAV